MDNYDEMLAVNYVDTNDTVGVDRKYGGPDLYVYYIRDIHTVPCNDDETNAKLMLEIKVILDKLNLVLKKVASENFLQLNDDISIIDDKIFYCVDNCSESDELNELKLLYNQFTLKREELVSGNLRLVVSIAKEFYRDNIVFCLSDVIQYGNLGLMIAVEKYKLGTGAAFTTYAYYWIRKEIIKNLRKISYPVNVPYYLVDDYHSIMSVRGSLTQEFGREPTISELADYLGMSVLKLEKILMTFAQSISLDETLDFLVDDGLYSRVDYVSDETVDIYEEVSGKGLKEQLVMYMSTYLTERENYVLCQRFGIDCSPRTFCDIASELGVSHQLVGQIQNKAIKKLKKAPQFKALIDYLR